MSGEAFSVGGWRAARVVLAETVGAVVDPGAEPEAWGQVLGEVMATEGLAFPTSSNDEVSWLAHTVGGEVPEAYRPGGALAWDRKPR